MQLLSLSPVGSRCLWEEALRKPGAALADNDALDHTPLGPEQCAVTAPSLEIQPQVQPPADPCSRLCLGDEGDPWLKSATDLMRLPQPDPTDWRESRRHARLYNQHSGGHCMPRCACARHILTSRKTTNARRPRYALRGINNPHADNDGLLTETVRASLREAERWERILRRGTRRGPHATRAAALTS